MNNVKELKIKNLKEYKEILEENFNLNLSYSDMKKLYNEMKNSNTYCLGYFVSKKLAGTITIDIVTSPSGKETIIRKLAVKEEYRRRGIANTLMLKAEEISKENKSARILFVSNFKRKAAHSLYEKLGYDGGSDRAFIKYL